MRPLLVASFTPVPAGAAPRHAITCRAVLRFLLSPSPRSISVRCRQQYVPSTPSLILLLSLYANLSAEGRSASDPVVLIHGRLQLACGSLPITELKSAASGDTARPLATGHRCCRRPSVGRLRAAARRSDRAALVSYVDLLARPAGGRLGEVMPICGSCRSRGGSGTCVAAAHSYYLDGGDRALALIARVVPSLAGPSPRSAHQVR